MIAVKLLFSATNPSLGDDLIRRSDCRLCKSRDLVEVLDLGKVALAGGFLRKNQFEGEKKYPLRVFFCKNCKLVQLLDVVPPDELFRDYFYQSSSTKTLSSHFAEYAKYLFGRGLVRKGSFVVEIGSNDGVLLAPLKGLGARVLGVDPAENVAAMAESRGIEVVKDYFTEKVASEISERQGKADVILANNVFAHIDDLDEVVRGVKAVIKEDGVFIFEVHYILDLIEKMQYDTIYHEHLCYYSLMPLIDYFRGFGMEIFDVERIPTHAGSMRVYARPKGNGKISESVRNLLKTERDMGLDRLDTYLEFSERVREQKRRLMGLLRELKNDGKKIIGYGAPGRGNTLLNYCGIDTGILDYLIDMSPLRQGTYTPGTHIPVFPPEKMKNDKPDYALMLAWSYMSEIVKKEQDFIRGGGKFIIPLPEVKIIP